VGRVDDYRLILRALPRAEWDALLAAESGLPGPRGNLELAEACVLEADADQLERWRGSGDEYLVFCGVLGLDDPAAIRRWAGDPRWRIREAVAMALQRLGDRDLKRLVSVLDDWADGDAYEQRAAAAALCEPRLLRRDWAARAAVDLVDRITSSYEAGADRRSDASRALRKGLGYCWSVAVAASPDEGKAAFERRLGSDDRDIRWILRENLRKRRLERMDPEWVDAAIARLAEA
jgi:hypothetical protein